MGLYDINKKKIEDESGFRDLEYAVHRGKLLSSFLKKLLPAADRNRIIDLGCGKGGLSIAFSDDFKKVDSNPQPQPDPGSQPQPDPGPQPRPLYPMHFSNNNVNFKSGNRASWARRSKPCAAGSNGRRSQPAKKMGVNRLGGTHPNN